MHYGARGYLSSVSDTSNATPSIEFVHVVNEVIDVFLNTFFVLPQVRHIDFCIDLLPVKVPISKAPYRMTPAELIRRSKCKGLIRPSVSPWGAPVHFVKKERWVYAALHRLPRVEQGDDKEQVSPLAHR